MIGFILSSMIRGINRKEKQAWSQGIVYAQGDVVISGNKKYIAMNNGTSGQIVPQHNTGQATDGEVIWLFVEALDAIDPPTETVYLGVGTDKPVYFKQLSSTSFSASVSYIKWKSGLKVQEKDIVLHNNNVFVVVVGGTSTVEPSDTSAFNVKTADGIVWRYCGEIVKSKRRFITDEKMPIDMSKYQERNVQWTCEIVSQNGTISQSDIPRGIGAEVTPEGKLQKPWVTEQTSTDIVTIGSSQGKNGKLKVELDNGKVKLSILEAGEGYSTGEEIIVVGNGSGFKGKIKTDSNGSITELNITNEGENYTWAEYRIVSANNAVVKITRLPYAPWGILNNGSADSFVINTSIHDVEGIINSATSYDTVWLVCTETGQKRNVKELPKYIELFKHKLTEIKQRSVGQEESITIQINLE